MHEGHVDQRSTAAYAPVEGKDRGAFPAEDLSSLGQSRAADSGPAGSNGAESQVRELMETSAVRSLGIEVTSRNRFGVTSRASLGFE